MITSWPALAAFTPPLMPCKERRSLVHRHGHGLIQLYCQSSEMENINMTYVQVIRPQGAQARVCPWLCIYLEVLQPTAGRAWQLP